MLGNALVSSFIQDRRICDERDSLAALVSAAAFAPLKPKGGGDIGAAALLCGRGFAALPIGFVFK
jgi:hypothetical protein